MKTVSWIIPLVLSQLLTVTCWASTELDEARRAVRMQNFSLAAELFQRAASQGDSEARYQLANLYLLGRGVAKDESTAMQLLSAAASQGHPAAQYNLGIRLLKDDETSGMLLINQAAANDYQAALSFLQNNADRQSSENAPIADTTENWLGSARIDDVNAMQKLLPVIDDVNSKDSNGRTALHVAVQFRSSQVVEWLLQQGANPDSTDRFGLSPLAEAISTGQEQITLLLLAHSRDLSQSLPNGDSLLHLAVRQQQPAIAAALLEIGTTPNSRNSDGWTPLDLAVQSENYEVATALQNGGATHSPKWVELNQASSKNRRATMLEKTLASEEWNATRIAQLVVSDQAAALQSVLDRNPELANSTLEDGSNLLALALKNNLTEATEVLLNSGADPNQKIYGEITALHIAARQGNQELIKLLLQHGANPLAKDQDDWDTMDWAVTENQLATATLLTGWLIDNKSSIPENIPFGRYVLLASQHDITPLVRVLLPHAVREEFDEIGRNSVWFAASNGNEEMLALLLKAGMTAASTDRQGRTPFHVSVRSGCMGCINLLSTVSELNRQTDSGYSPLMIAVANDHYELVHWLINNGANIELRNSQGNTALALAVEQNLVEITRLLLESGANVTRKNNLGYSALDIARDKNPELYEELRSHTVLGLF